MESVKKFVTEHMRMQTNDSLTQHYLLDRQLARLFNQVINRGNKLGIRISGDNVMIQRSMSMYLSFVRTIGELHDGAVHFTLLQGVMRHVYDDALLHGFEQRPMPEMSEARAYEVAANWLSMIAEKDRRLFRLVIDRGIS